MLTVIWWIRRDLRLADNPALTAALAAGRQVIPCFIIDPRLMDGPAAAEKRRAFLLAGLHTLDTGLRARGSRLVIRMGNPLAELLRLRQESGAAAVFAEADFSPFARRRDARIAAQLPLHLHGGPTLRHPNDVLKADGTPYTVFTPYKRAWLNLPLPSAEHLLPAPTRLHTPAGLTSLPLPPVQPPELFPPGETEAQNRLCRFTSGPIARYADTRNLLAEDGTSRLSPYLRFGMISARQAIVAARTAVEAADQPAARQGAETWLSELVWREFYAAILFHFPHVLHQAFRPVYRQIAWNDSPAALKRWQEGLTGYPVVDAAMRQLQATGWMHNRARMLTASFLVKDLLIDWRQGEQWFMQNLVDGDPAANNGGWQWTAGVGTDAVPYFRIFNPVTQSRRFDPHGAYIRRWLPELAHLPDAAVHAPWEKGYTVPGYPSPLVDHKLARQRTLAAFAQARRQFQEVHHAQNG